MAGAHSAISWNGARSEILAEYVFSSWGPVVRGRWEFDYGIDLYCSLSTTVGQRAWVGDSYTVQVKSNRDPWVFKDPDEIRWLIEHPSPLFLCVVDKAAGQISVHQTMSRFHLGSHGGPIERLELEPGEGTAGGIVPMAHQGKIQLGAPILRMTSTDLFDAELIATLRPVLASWIAVEQRNVRLFRNGLRTAPTPSTYTTNKVLPGGGMETLPPLGGAELVSVAASLTEVLELIGRRFYLSGYGHGAVHTALLLRWLERVVPRSETAGSVPGMDGLNLWMVLGDSTREAFSREDAFAEIDALLAVVENHPAMRAVVERTTRDRENNERRLREALVALGRLPPP